MKRLLLCVLFLAVVAPAVAGVAGCKSDSDEVEIDGPDGSM